MRVKTELSKKIERYLLKNPINRAAQKPYLPAAQAMGTTEEKVRQVWRSIRRSGQVSDVYVVREDAATTFTSSSGTTTLNVDEVNSAASVTKNTTEEVTNIDQLIRICGIDTEVWTVNSWECKRYNAWVRADNGDTYSEPKFTVSAKLTKRILDKDLGKQKDAIMAELFSNSPVVKKYEPTGGAYANCLYEVCIPDIHFSKLSWSEETGEDFDLKISVDRYKKAVFDLLDRVDTSVIGRILFPIGNDMIHVDNEHNTTFAGTPQDADGRFAKTIRVVKDVLVDVIVHLSTIAPVDVLVVRGNHDSTVSFMIGEILDAYFHNNENIQIYNSPKWRKYYQFGATSIMMAHGDKEKHTDLGLIFATEEPQLWAATKHRFCQLGHFHKSKTTSYISVDTHNGFQVQILPSLTATDDWHFSKGYLAKKQAKSFLFDMDEGLIAEFTYTL